MQQVFQRFSGSLQKILEDIDRCVAAVAPLVRRRRLLVAPVATNCRRCLSCWPPASRSTASPHLMQATGEPGEPHGADQPGAAHCCSCSPCITWSSN